jgi:hypothetical protein
MAEPNIIPKSYEELLQLISDKANADGDDWRIKVLRRPTLTGNMESVAILDDARAEHFTNAEMWLSQLCGGGPHYVLHAIHAKNPRVPFCYVVPPLVSGPSRAPDPEKFPPPGWVGPRSLISPARAEPQTVSSILAGGTSPGRSAATDNRSDGRAPGLLDPVWAELQRREREIDAKAAAASLEAVRRESEAQARRLEERIALLGAAKPAPSLDLAGLITAAAALVTPIVSKLMESAAATRAALAVADASRASRDDVRRSEEMKLYAEMMKDARSSGQVQMQAIGTMLDSQAQATRVMMQTVASAIELIGPRGEENPWIPVITEGMKAFGGLLEAQAKAGGANAAGMPGNGAAPGQPHPFFQQPVLNGSPRGPVPGGFAGVQPPIPGAPAGAVRAVPPVPPTPPVQAAPPAPVDPRLAEPDGAGGLTDGDEEGEEGSLLDSIEDAIRHMDPPEEVVGALFEAFGDAASVQEIKTAGGLGALVQARLGAWLREAPTHLPYLQSIMDELKAEGQRRGVGAAPAEAPSGSVAEEPAPG